MTKEIDKFKKELEERNSKKRKKKGFTLVELLAVFVILAIIAGIAIFYMNNVKKTFTVSVYKESVKNLLTAAQNYYSANSETAFPSAGLSIFDDNLAIENKSEYTGGLVFYNSITGKLEAKNVTNSDYCANGPLDNLIINEGVCPSTDLACFSYKVEGDGVTITNFDYSNSACTGFAVVPSTIENLPVTKIGFAAFADVNKTTPTYCTPSGSSLPSRLSSSNSTNITATPMDIKRGFLDDPSCFSYTTSYSLSLACPVPSDSSNTQNEKTKVTLLSNAKTMAKTELAVAMYCSPYSLEGVKIGENGSKLLGVILPSTITYIDNLAFAKTALTTINISSLTNLTYIGDSSFKYTNLTSLDLSGLRKLKTIGYSAFASSNIKNLKISNLNSLQEIRTGAFYENNIENVDFTGTNNIIHIGYSSFYGNQISSIKINNLTKLYSLWNGAFCNNPFEESSSTMPNVSNLDGVSESNLDSACLYAGGY